MRVITRGLLLAVLVTWLPAPASVAAHDDPIVTVRVLCNGFNVLDMDAVLGELSDSASISVDRPVRGRREIEAWVREQMDHDLRIEIVDIGTPQKLQDGYTLSWTARLSRQDWRVAGTPSRQLTNAVEIRNGRITQWDGRPTAANNDGQSAEAPQAGRSSMPGKADQQSSPIPDLFGIPLTLLGAAACGALLVSVFAVRRVR